MLYKITSRLVYVVHAGGRRPSLSLSFSLHAALKTKERSRAYVRVRRLILGRCRMLSQEEEARVNFVFRLSFRLPYFETASNLFSRTCDHHCSSSGKWPLPSNALSIRVWRKQEELSDISKRIDREPVHFPSGRPLQTRFTSKRTCFYFEFRIHTRGLSNRGMRRRFERLNDWYMQIRYV